MFKKLFAILFLFFVFTQTSYAWMANPIEGFPDNSTWESLYTSLGATGFTAFKSTSATAGQQYYIMFHTRSLEDLMSQECWYLNNSSGYLFKTSPSAQSGICDYSNNDNRYRWTGAAWVNTGFSGLTSDLYLDQSNSIGTNVFSSLPLWANNMGTGVDYGANYNNLGMVYNGDLLLSPNEFYEYDPTMEMTNFEASPSGQFARVDLSGDTATYSASLTFNCEIDIYQFCGITDDSTLSDEGIVGTIHISPRYSTPSAQLQAVQLYGGDNPPDFVGYDWGVDGDTTWKRDDFVIPYEQGQQCRYPQNVYCTEKVIECSYDQDGIQHCVWTDTIIHKEFYGNTLEGIYEATSSGTTFATLFTEPEPTNPLSWIVWSLKKWFWETFNLSDPFSAWAYQSLKNKMQQRAPFAYVLPVFEINTVSTASSSAIPSLQLSFIADDAEAAYGIDGDVSWDAPDFMDTFLSTVRTFLQFVLWLFFFGYLIKLPSRVMPE